MKEIYSEIVINSSSQKVWQTLLDFDRFPEWNQYIRFATGQPIVGKKITIHTQPPGARQLVFHPTLLKVEPERELRWIGSSLPKFLFAGEHSFILERVNDNRTKFIQKESFNGLLVPFLTMAISKRTTIGFHIMNEALKKRIEDSA